jgi:predicted PurR-regulated permease PerM
MIQIQVGHSAFNIEENFMSPDVITSLVSTLGIVGALVWYLYHNTTQTIPNLTKQYTESQEKVANTFAETQNKFADTQDKITDRFSQTLAEERMYRKQEIAALQDWIRNEASCKYNQDRH